MTTKFSKETGIALLLVVIACLVVCLPVLWTDGVLYFRDHSLIFRRLMHEVRLAYGDMRLPLWDAMAGAGEPLAAYPAALPYSPLLPFLGIGDFDFGYRLFVMAHVPLAALGAFLLGRSLNFDSVSCAGMAILYALGGSFLSFNNLLPAFESAAIAPWVMALALGVARTPTPLKAVGFSVLLALHVMVGDPVFLLADAMVFLVAWWPSARGRSYLKELGALLSLAILAALVGGIAIIPLLDLLSNSTRGAGFTYDQLATFSLNPARISELFLPGISGDPVQQEILFSSQEDGRLYLYSIYIGASTLPLYILATRIKKARAWLVLSCLFLLIALGRYTPLHELIVEFVPGLSSSRYPVKFMYGAHLSLTIAFGYAFQTLPKLNTAQLKKYLAIPVLLSVLTISLSLVLQHDWLVPFLGPNLSLDAGYKYIAGAASFGLVFIILSGGLILTQKRSLILGVVLLDLGIAAQSAFPLAPAELYQTPPVYKLISQDTPEPSVFLYSYYHAPTRIRKVTAVDSSYHQLQRLSAGVGVPLGIRYIFDPNLNQVRPQSWLDIEQQFKVSDEPSRINLLGRLGVTHLLVEAGNVSPPGLVNLGTAPVHGGDPITAFRLKKSRSYVTLASRVRSAKDRQEALKQIASSNAFNETVIEEAIITKNQIKRIESASSSTTGDLSNLEHTPGHIQVTATSTVPSILILAQTFNKDWVASIDNKSTSVFPVDVVMTGIFVPPGTHEIRIDYAPKSWTAGAISSAIGLGILFLVMLFGFRRSKGRLSHNPDDRIQI